MLIRSFALLALFAAPALADDEGWAVNVDIRADNKPAIVATLSGVAGGCASTETAGKDERLYLSVCHKDPKDPHNRELQFSIEQTTQSGTRKLQMPMRLTARKRVVLSRLLTGEGTVEFGATLR
jgi:hypothetical protein